MTDAADKQTAENRLRYQAEADQIRITAHAHQEMAEECIEYDALREALINGVLIENYPEHQRGACCLMCGESGGRYLHVVCTTSLETAVIITVYEPMPPKWTTPFQRRKQ